MDSTGEAIYCSLPQSRGKYCTESCTANFFKSGRLTCNCGEDNRIFHWSWEEDAETNNKILSDKNRTVLFHPLYSSGTACVKGNTPFRANKHYYWEIKMISNLYGTDVMVGVGTSKVSPQDWKLRFCSMLGFDSQSWGYSYHGSLQHDKQSRKYGLRFGLGSIVGIHLDMTTGTLQYFLNRKPLGVAFTGLKNYELYPMVSSTAAQSAIKLSCAMIIESTLLLDCLSFIRNNPAVLDSYNKVPGLSQIFEKKYFWCLPPKEAKSKRSKLELEDEVVLSSRNNRHSQKRKRVLYNFDASDIAFGQMLYVMAKRNCNSHGTSGSNDTPETSSPLNLPNFSGNDTDSEYVDIFCPNCQTWICSEEELLNEVQCNICGFCT